MHNRHQKKAAKEVAETTLLKKAAKKGAKKFARKKLGNKLAEQTSLKIARDKVADAMEKKGIKSFRHLNKTTSKKHLTSTLHQGKKLRSGRTAAKTYLKKTHKRSIQLKQKGFRTYRNLGSVGRPSSIRSLIHLNNQTVSGAKYDKIMRNPVKRAALLKNYGKEKDATILRQNMCIAMGSDAKYFPTSIDNRAHHIVGGGRESLPARTILQKYGIDINDPRNGIILPNNNKSIFTGQIHNGKHSNSYFDAVNKELKNCKSQEDCINALQRIKNKLISGEIPLYSVPSYNL